MYEQDRAADLASMGIITVGDLLGTAARAIAANFVPYAVVMVLVTSPAIVLRVAVAEWMHAQLWEMTYGTSPYGDPLDATALASVASLGVSLLQTALGFFAQAALMYATVEYMAGRRASIGEALSGSFSNAGAVLGLAILNTLATWLATLACIVPGIIVMCVLFASVPAAVVERLGPIEAMQRSADLTSGHRWTIFFTLLVAVCVLVVFACPLGLGLHAAGATDPLPSLPARIANYAVDWSVSLFFSTLQATVAAVFYARVRGVRDGVDAAAIARVFE